LSDPSTKTDVVLGNLVLHHFTDAQLTLLFSEVADKANALVAVEPRRSRWPLFCARLLALIGCNAVTRHDALISVRAGFTGRELSALWPRSDEWELTERRAGLFSHLFVARRKIHSDGKNGISNKNLNTEHLFQVPMVQSNSQRPDSSPSPPRSGERAGVRWCSEGQGAKLGVLIRSLLFAATK
jgi:hypothetical protein